MPLVITQVKHALRQSCGRYFSAPEVKQGITGQSRFIQFSSQQQLCFLVVSNGSCMLFITGSLLARN
jgi:hypothetical protein